MFFLYHQPKRIPQFKNRNFHWLFTSVCSSKCRFGPLDRSVTEIAGPWADQSRAPKISYNLLKKLTRAPENSLKFAILLRICPTPPAPPLGGHEQMWYVNNLMISYSENGLSLWSKTNLRTSVVKEYSNVQKQNQQSVMSGYHKYCLDNIIH